jgi:non-ribosomal peptide synthetase component F
LPPGTALLELLRQVQDSLSRLMEHQHLGLAEVQGLAGLGELFDTLVVFENYPVDRAGLTAQVGGLRLTDFRGLDATHYPLSLAAHPGERLQLQLSYRPDLFERASVEAIAGRLVRLLEGAVADPDRAIGKLDILAPASVTPSCGSGTPPRVRSLWRPCRSCLRRRWRARLRRMRWCSRMSG